MAYKKRKKKFAAKDKKGKAFSSALFFISFVIAACVVAYYLLLRFGTGDFYVFDYKPMIVENDDSMEPEIMNNGFVIIKKSAYENVEVGQLIGIKPPDYNTYIVRRAAIISENGIRTKADTSDKMDPYYITENDLAGEVIQISNSLSEFATKLTEITPMGGFLAWILFPALILIIAICGIAFIVRRVFRNKAKRYDDDDLMTSEFYLIQNDVSFRENVITNSRPRRISEKRSENYYPYNTFDRKNDINSDNVYSYDSDNIRDLKYNEEYTEYAGDLTPDEGYYYDRNYNDYYGEENNNGYYYENESVSLKRNFDKQMDRYIYEEDYYDMDNTYVERDVEKMISDLHGYL